MATTENFYGLSPIIYTNIMPVRDIIFIYFWCGAKKGPIISLSQELCGFIPMIRFIIITTRFYLQCTMQNIRVLLKMQISLLIYAILPLLCYWLRYKMDVLMEINVSAITGCIKSYFMKRRDYYDYREQWKLGARAEARAEARADHDPDHLIQWNQRAGAGADH